VAGLSGVYLGDGWLLTAGHVITNYRGAKIKDVVLDGHVFQLRPESVVLIEQGGVRADLAVVRIDGQPELKRLAIAKKSPAVGARLFLAGNGPLREPARTYWDAAGREVPASSPHARSGFKWFVDKEKGAHGMHWGTNQVATKDAISPGPGGTSTRVFGTRFREEGATPDESQAGPGDSGGPVFVKTAKGYELAGIMLAISGQHPKAAIFGDQTYIADLAIYRDAILRAIKRE
jgi:secreted trypsin-like serine protease